MSSKLVYDTDEARFEFDLPPAMEKLEHYATEHNVDEARELINFIAESSDDSITIPTDYDYFGYIALDLLDKNIGSVKCKSCNKIYKPDQLKPTIVGHAKSPLSIVLVAMVGHWFSAAMAYFPMMCRTPNRVMGAPLALRNSW